MRVLKTSIWPSGSLTGEYRCSLAVRALRRSFDQGKVMYRTSGPSPWYFSRFVGAHHEVQFLAGR